MTDMSCSTKAPKDLQPQKGWIGCSAAIPAWIPVLEKSKEREGACDLMYFTWMFLPSFGFNEEYTQACTNLQALFSSSSPWPGLEETVRKGRKAEVFVKYSRICRSVKYSRIASCCLPSRLITGTARRSTGEHGADRYNTRREGRGIAGER